MYKIVISNTALKEINNLSDKMFIRVNNAINSLKDEPRPKGCKKLLNIVGYRIRVGDYRILYRIKDEELEIFVFKVALRKDVYRN